jgi:2-haloacid dehalogenase
VFPGFLFFKMSEIDDVKVLAFDVFGTVVDWYSTVVREIEAFGLPVDADAFALDWRAGYKPAIRKVAEGEMEWTRVSRLQRTRLEELLKEREITSLDEDQKEELNRVWRRLDPWPDSVEGLARLRARFMVCTLSNANLGLLAEMAKNAGLPWDCILSAEVFREYKPHPATYLGVAEIFEIEPREVMLVAAHHRELHSARACGLQTAYVERPREFGPNRLKDVYRNAEHSLHAKDLVHLATLLGC